MHNRVYYGECEQLSGFKSWKHRVSELKKNTYALYLASRDPRVPWYAKVILVMVVAYVLSPIDLIPDFIPVLGYLDDLVVLSIAIAAALRLIPRSVWRKCQEKSQCSVQEVMPRNWTAAMVIIGIWLLVLSFIVFVIWRTFWR